MNKRTDEFITTIFKMGLHGSAVVRALASKDKGAGSSLSWGARNRITNGGPLCVELACSPCACMGLLWKLQLSPTFIGYLVSLNCPYM